MPRMGRPPAPPPNNRSHLLLLLARPGGFCHNSCRHPDRCQTPLRSSHPPHELTRSSVCQGARRLCDGGVVDLGDPLHTASDGEARVRFEGDRARRVSGQPGWHWPTSWTSPPPFSNWGRWPGAEATWTTPTRLVGSLGLQPRQGRQQGIVECLAGLALDMGQPETAVQIRD